MKPYTDNEKMNNYVQYIKNELDDAYINLSDARSNLKSIANQGISRMAYSSPYADSLADTIGAIQKLIESLKEQVADKIEAYVSEEYPIKEEEE